MVKKTQRKSQRLNRQWFKKNQRKSQRLNCQWLKKNKGRTKGKCAKGLKEKGVNGNSHLKKTKPMPIWSTVARTAFQKIFENDARRKGHPYRKKSPPPSFSHSVEGLKRGYLSDKTLIMCFIRLFLKNKKNPPFSSSWAWV